MVVSFNYFFEIYLQTVGFSYIERQTSPISLPTRKYEIPVDGGWTAQ